MKISRYTVIPAPSLVLPLFPTFTVDPATDDVQSHTLWFCHL